MTVLVQTKRGSFLARGENALARIADVTRTSAGGPSVGPKNSRNFVFATVSPEKAEESGGTEPASAQVGRRIVAFLFLGWDSVYSRSKTTFTYFCVPCT